MQANSGSVPRGRSWHGLGRRLDRKRHVRLFLAGRQPNAVDGLAVVSDDLLAFVGVEVDGPAGAIGEEAGADDAVNSRRLCVSVHGDLAGTWGQPANCNDLIS
jgi:hypothetical protein